MYSVRIYKSTGFNAVNPPDRPALLEQCTHEDFPAVDILTNVEIPYIRIRATKSQLDGADYCAVYTSGLSDAWFYSIPPAGINPYSVDVWEVSLVPDYVLTAGGIVSVWGHILDGIIERSHVSDDTYGKWTAEDELLQNSQPLILETKLLQFSQSTLDVVESSIDLGATRNVLSGEYYIADNDGEDVGVTVPVALTNLITTSYHLDGKTAVNQRTTVAPLQDRGNVREGIERARALGIENAVIATASIPSDLVSGTTVTENVTQSGDDVDNTISGSGRTIKNAKLAANDAGGVPQSAGWQIYSDLTGVFTLKNTQFTYIYSQTMKNTRVLYGGLNRVGILTTAGNRLEARPEETTGGGRQELHIRSVGDPHLSGRPYHRFEYMNGNASTTGFWQNAVTGLPWKSIPLVYTEKKGNALDRINFENSREITDLQYGLSKAGQYDFLASSELGIFARMLTGNAPQNGGPTAGESLAVVAGAIGGLTSGGVPGAGVVSGAYGEGVGYARARETYETTKRQEMQQFAISQVVRSPEINFAYDGEAFRDFYGETVIAYRYRPTDADLVRMDKILTMYGYKTCIPASEASVTNRVYFNYIKGNVTVGGDGMSRRIADGISAQISGGMRFWHVLPSNQYYAENPIAQQPTP